MATIAVLVDDHRAQSGLGVDVERCRARGIRAAVSGEDAVSGGIGPLLSLLRTSGRGGDCRRRGERGTMSLK
jgi:hypothetical protein